MLRLDVCEIITQFELLQCISAWKLWPVCNKQGGLRHCHRRKTARPSRGASCPFLPLPLISHYVLCSLYLLPPSFAFDPVSPLRLRALRDDLVQVAESRSRQKRAQILDVLESRDEAVFSPIRLQVRKHKKCASASQIGASSTPSWRWRRRQLWRNGTTATTFVNLTERLMFWIF